MNADFFDRGSHPCPICDRPNRYPTVKTMGGLLTCPQCRSRLVVSFSGHYVRDPFGVKRSANQRLRQQSRPIARILRDSGVAKHSSLIALLSALILVSFSMTVLTRTNGQVSLQNWMQQIIKSQRDS